MSEIVLIGSARHHADELAQFQRGMDEAAGIKKRRRLYLLPPFALDCRPLAPHNPPPPAQRCSYCNGALNTGASCRGCGAPH